MQNKSPPHEGGTLARLLGREDAIRTISIRSGISAPTLRSIAARGFVSSYATAVMIERATDGAIKAEMIALPSAKGSDLYRREPARSILFLALDREVSVARFLGLNGLTMSDLWNFMNAPEGKYEGSKERLKSLLLKHNLPTIREDRR